MSSKRRVYFFLVQDKHWGKSFPSAMIKTHAILQEYFVAAAGLQHSRVYRTNSWCLLPVHNPGCWVNHIRTMTTQVKLNGWKSQAAPALFVGLSHRCSCSRYNKKCRSRDRKTRNRWIPYYSLNRFYHPGLAAINRRQQVLQKFAMYQCCSIHSMLVNQIETNTMYRDCCRCKLKWCINIFRFLRLRDSSSSCRWNWIMRMNNILHWTIHLYTCQYHRPQSCCRVNCNHPFFPSLWILCKSCHS